jgi:hypothetical protein
MAAARRAVDKYSGKWVGKAVLTPTLAAIRLRYRLTSLTLVRNGDVWAVEGAVNPRQKWVTTIHITNKDYDVSTKEPNEKDEENIWTDAIKSALVVELDKAVKVFLATGLTPGQVAKLIEYRTEAIAAKRAGQQDGPFWGEFWKFFYRARGERVHAAFKTSVALNPALADLTLFTPGVKEPDIRTPVDSMSGRWWADVTTEGEWTAHVTKYSATFGPSALGLIYKIKGKKHSGEGGK